MKDLHNVKIICCDVDGTLLPWNGKDLSYTAAVIDRLQKKGIEFVLCTGRGYHNIPEPLRTVPGLRYAITANGALVLDVRNGRILRDRRFPAELILKVSDFILTRPYPVQLYCYKDGYHYVDTTYPVDFVPDRQSLIDWMNSAEFCSFREFMDSSEPFDKLGVISLDSEIKDRVCRELAAQDFAEKIFVTTSGDWNLEINAAGGEKGAAALWLCDELGLTPDELLTAGDNFNDMSMLRCAAFSVAPENAEEDVKAAAAFVVPDCAEDGVEKFFEKLLAE